MSKKCKCDSWVRDEHTDWQMKQRHHKDCPDAGRKKRLFYYEEAVNAWVPLPDQTDCFISEDCFEVGDEQEYQVKCAFLNDEEMANLPEAL